MTAPWEHRTALVSTRRRIRRAARVALTVASALTLVAISAAAAVPSRFQLEGALLATGGVPAVDGAYAMKLHVYDGKDAKAPALTLALGDVAAKGGRFAALVTLDAPQAAALGAVADPWMGMQIGAEPELPRQPFAAAPFALHAASAATLACTGCVGGDAIANGGISAAKVGFLFAGAATKGGPALDLSCTGCVSVAELSFDGDVDLGGNSIKAKNGTFGGDVAAKTVTAGAFVGDGSKLTGLAVPSGSCPKGQGVTGIAADGSLQCAALGAALPADGLDDVSAGMLSTEFVEKIASLAPLGIPDNTGADATGKLVVPAWGKAKALTIKVKLANTDLSTLRLRLLPPDDKKVGYVLCDPCGEKDAKALDTAWGDKNPAKSGDLSAWIGKEVTGEWLLVATDSSFCLKQAPGNAALCDLDNKLDGAIESWSIEAGVVSSKKVAVGGALIFHAAETAPVPCTAATFGAAYANSKDQALYICNGKDWAAVFLSVPGTKENPVASCKDLQTKVPTAKSGSYWVAGGGTPVEVTCDMTTDGGGWTRVAVEAETDCGTGLPTGWSDGKQTDATVAGKCTRVHGMWGAGVAPKKTFDLLKVPHSQARVHGRYYAVDSWDNEANGAQVWVDGSMRWSATKTYASGGSGQGWVTATFAPAPWGNNSHPNGYWVLQSAFGALGHSADTLTLEFRTGIDQDLSDESFGFSHVEVWVR